MLPLHLMNFVQTPQNKQYKFKNAESQLLTNVPVYTNPRPIHLHRSKLQPHA